MFILPKTLGKVKFSITYNIIRIFVSAVRDFVVLARYIDDFSSGACGRKRGFRCLDAIEYAIIELT